MIENDQTHAITVARNSTYLIIQGLIVKIWLIAYLFFATRYLPTVAEFGIASALTLLSGLLPMLTSFAIPTAVTKFIAEHTGKADNSTAKAIQYTSIRYGIAFSLTAALITYAASTPIANLMLGSQELENIVKIFSIEIFLITLIPFLLKGLEGFQEFGKVALASSLQSSLKYTAAIVLLVHGQGLLGIVTGWVIGDIAGVLLIFYYILRCLPKAKASNFSVKRLVHYSFPLYPSSIIAYFSTTIDSFIILTFVGNEALGLYRVAISASGALLIISTAMNRTLFPKLSEITGIEEKGLSSASRTASRYIFLIYTPLAIGLAATANPTITLLAGQRYTASVPVLALLSVIMALTSTGVIVGSLLLSTGRTKLVLYTNIIATAISLVISVLFIIPFGVMGAALGRSASIVLMFAIPALVLRKEGALKLDVDAFKKSLLASFVMGLLVLVVEAVLPNKHLLPLYIAVGGITYFVAIKFLKVLNHNDIKLIGQFFPNRLNGLFTSLAKFLTS